MGLFDRAKHLFYKPEPLSPAALELKTLQEQNASDIRRFQRYIERYSEQLASLQAEGNGPDSSMYQNVAEELRRFEYSLYEAEKTTKFLRENTAEDVAYREQQMDSFSEKLRKLIPEGEGVCFHGTPIYFAEEILKSGGISSTAARFDGYVRSTDRANEISVSDLSSLHRTVNYFMDLSAYQRCLPCGCLFVLSGAGQTDEQKRRSVMNSIDFRTEPERLLGVVSSPENEPCIRQWLSDCGLSADLAFTFDKFISELEVSHGDFPQNRPASFGPLTFQSEKCGRKVDLTDLISSAESRTCVHKNYGSRNVIDR